MNLSTGAQGAVFYQLQGASLVGTPASFTRDGAGIGLIWLRDGSTPVARLNVSVGGSPSAGIPMAPGARLDVRFKSLTFSAGGVSSAGLNGSASYVGFPSLAVANFIVLTGADADYRESELTPAVTVPLQLFYAAAYVPGTLPGILTAPNVAGWRRLRLTVGGAAGGQLTAGCAFLVTPYVFDADGNQIALPNASFPLVSGASGAPSSNFCQVIDTTSFTMFPGLGSPGISASAPVLGNARLGFEVDQTAGAAQATIAIQVDGLE